MPSLLMLLHGRCRPLRFQIVTWLLLAAAMATVFPAHAQPLELLEVYDPSTSLMLARLAEVPEPTAEPWVVRRQPALVRMQAILEAQLEVGDTVRFPLFDGRTVDGRIHAIERRDGGFDLTGELIGAETGEFFAALRGGVLTATLRPMNAPAFEVRYRGGGVHEIRELRLQMQPECAPETPVPPTPAEAPTLAEALPVARPDEPVTFDLMVLYTTKARTSAGGTEAIEGMIANAVNMANQAYVNSGVAARAQLVHTAEVVYEESSSMGANLDALEAIDGRMDEVHLLRESYKADAVMLIVAPTTYDAFGIAYLLNPTDPFFGAYAFGVVHLGALPNHTLTHELGHLMGCAHARGDDPGEDSGNPFFPYGYGYRFGDGKYRTIMAYAPGERIAQFSNPEKTYLGYATGVPDGPEDAADNARVINTTIIGFANFREPSVPPVELTGGPFTLRGTWGGPFDPVDGAPVLVNNIGRGVEWRVEVLPLQVIDANAPDSTLNLNVLTATPPSGALAPGEQVALELKASPDAARIPPGSYSVQLRFDELILGGSSYATVLIEVGDVTTYRFEPIASPQEAGTPFPVTLTAIGTTGQNVAGFAGNAWLDAVRLGEPADRIIGSTALASPRPVDVRYEIVRMQSLYRATELNLGPSMLTALALHFDEPPAVPLNQWTIRLQPSAAADAASMQWTASGWTTVFRDNITIDAPGWHVFTFQRPFFYDGTSNLLVDFSFHNPAGMSAAAPGRVASTNQTGPRSILHYGNQELDDPLTWTGNSPVPFREMATPTIRLTARSHASFAVQPPIVGPFVEGVWNGEVTVLVPAEDVSLMASDVHGRLGFSTAFAVEAPPPPPPPATRDVVWVDFDWTGQETGAEDAPFNTLGEAMQAVEPGGTIRVRAGSSDEKLRLTRPVRIEAVDGPVRIGD